MIPKLNACGRSRNIKRRVLTPLFGGVKNRITSAISLFVAPKSQFFAPEPKISMARPHCYLECGSRSIWQNSAARSNELCKFWQIITDHIAGKLRFERLTCRRIFVVKWRSLHSLPCYGKRLPQNTLRDRNDGTDIAYVNSIIIDSLSRASRDSLLVSKSQRGRVLDGLKSRIVNSCAR